MDRLAVWDAVHEALPARWRAGRVTFDPAVLRADGHMGTYSVTARGPHPERGRPPQTVTGHGYNEEPALCDLDSFTEWKSIYVDFSGRLQRAQIDNQESSG